MEELKRIVEALLFASPDPLSVRRIKSVVPGLETDQVIETLNELKIDYADDTRSFQIVEIGGGYQLTTKADYALWVGKLVETRGKQRLSRAALETLAIVAYKQPALRTTLEGIRGVNVDGVLRTLMERDLVRIVGRADGPGRPLLFGTTRDFLMQFGLSKLADLPGIEEIEKLVGPTSEMPADDVSEGEGAPGAEEDPGVEETLGVEEPSGSEELAEVVEESGAEELPRDEEDPEVVEESEAEKPPGDEEDPEAEGVPEADAEQTETE